MNPLRLISVAVVATVLFAAGLAQARPLPDGGVTAEEVAASLQAKGYKAEIGKDKGGDPKIHSGAEGVSFDIYFYGCNKGPRCSSLQFTVGFHVEGGMKLVDINTWNRSNRFGRAYLDDVNDPFVEMDLDVEHGFTSEAVENNIDTWDAVLGAFLRVVTCARHPGGDACKTSS